jgi:hypothetical protein
MRGRRLLAALNLATAVNGLLVDWNRTHLFNPRWPPHARFHDAMTISFGLLLGALGLHALRQGDARGAALGPAIFFGAQLSAFAYPGARGLEAEFPELVPRIGPIRLNEAPVALAMLGLAALGYAQAVMVPGNRIPPGRAAAISRPGGAGTSRRLSGSTRAR